MFLAVRSRVESMVATSYDGINWIDYDRDIVIEGRLPLILKRRNEQRQGSGNCQKQCHFVQQETQASLRKPSVVGHHGRVDGPKNRQKPYRKR